MAHISSPVGMVPLRHSLWPLLRQAQPIGELLKRNPRQVLQPSQVRRKLLRKRPGAKVLDALSFVHDHASTPFDVPTLLRVGVAVQHQVEAVGNAPAPPP